MPLLEINQSRYISASVRLDESTAEQVHTVRRFRPRIRRRCCGQGAQLCLLQGPRLSGLPQDASGQAGCLHVACPQRPEQGCGGAACKEACSRGGVHHFCTGNEGVILHSISCRSKNGASHRKNVDTPPLGGNCRATFVARWLPLKTDDLQKHGSYRATASKRRR
jgi:hypothetical protein